ncbi:alpha/beta fold hydrolase [Bacillus sp. Marseille-P3661]|uniref:alpha/beta fold hydrolase n=1 Tax=Bacillus sp. Marseille-P3661 TaxID=1936234 RepID=UPI0015E1A975|nr:alpha/beta hydrolase [Bacillus sp. Marseille-P3661]
MRIEGKYVYAGGIKTHYFEEGSGEPLILLHSGEYGGCAETSWEYNIDYLSQYFKVYAPDWLGYGKTEKLFDFTDMRNKRKEHIKEFMKTLNIESAYFIGNSMGASMLLEVAAETNPRWNIKKLIAISGGENAPENAARAILSQYDGSMGHYKKILQVCFYDEKWHSGPFLEKRYEASLEPGSWECTAAARFKAPFAPKRSRELTDYSQIKIPTLIVGGKQDPLKDVDYGIKLTDKIPNSYLEMFDNCSHCAHIEHHEQFNRLAVSFLLDR